jgi:hypothetical protein
LHHLVLSPELAFMALFVSVKDNGPPEEHPGTAVVYS